MNTDTAMKIISMVEACAVWAALFIAFYFIAKASGMKNSLPKEVKNRLAEFEKRVDAFSAMLKDSKPDTEKAISKAFSKVNHSQRMMSKIFAVYVYEHPLSTLAQQAFDTIASLRSKLQIVSKAIANSELNNMGTVSKHLEDIKPIIEKANSQLDFVIKEEDGEKYIKG